MPEWSVRWSARVEQTETVEAETADEAQDFVHAELAKPGNVDELLDIEIERAHRTDIPEDQQWDMEDLLGQ